MRLAAICLSLLCLSACQKSAATRAPAASSTAPATAATAAPAASKVARLIFIDKEHACACTQKRVDDAWAALQAALGTPAKVPVERIHIDTQASQAAPFTGTKPLMALPGIYFLDTKNAVVDLLQGEVKADEITAVLQRK